MYKIYDEKSRLVEVFDNRYDALYCYEHQEEWNFVQIKDSNAPHPLPWTFTDIGKLVVSKGFKNLSRWGRCPEI